MENSRTLIAASFAVLLAGAFAPTFVWAYKTNTHQGLTSATIASYEQVRGDAFTDAEEQAMITGSLDEDESTRPLQHFYDPVNNRGLTVLKSWEASRYWAEDTVAQANYCAWGICFKSIGFYDKYFSSPTDFSWERAVYEYAHGDKVRATETLGHVLHLVQDSTVPAHVRNDQHLNHDGFGDMDPYEEYTGQFGLSNIAATSITLMPQNDLASIFIGTAGYANNNFFSKDTILKVFLSPGKDLIKKENGFAVNKSTSRKIARVHAEIDLYGNVVEEWSIKSENDEVILDNWQALYTKSIQSGAEVMDLFFREVEKEKSTLALKEKNKSEFEKQPTQLALAGFGLVKSIYGSSLEQSDVEELLGEGSGQTASVITATTETFSYSEPPEIEEDISFTALPPPPPQLSSTPGPYEQNLDAPAPPVPIVPAEPTSPPSPNQQPPVPPPSTSPSSRFEPFVGGFAPGDGAWGGGGAAPAVETPAPPPAPVVTAPQDPVVSAPLEGAAFATTSIIASGTAEAGNIITLSYSTSATTTTADTSGNWSFAVDLAEGPYVLSFIASDGSGNSSNTISRNITIDLTSPNAPTANAAQCAYSLNPSLCLIAGTTAHIAWDAIADAARYAVSVNGITAGDTTDTSLSVSITANSGNDITITAFDAAGNAATSTPLAITALTRPVIINELSWAGTAASSQDEWIELKNISSYDIDMSNLALILDGTTVTLSGTFPAANPDNNTDIYLIERRSESTTADHALVASFDLDNAGDHLALVHLYGTGTTTVDQTPVVAACGGWCAGSAAYDLRTSVAFGTTTAILTMERTATSTDGSLVASWRSNDGYTTNASDAVGGTIYGTPRFENGTGLPILGWYCAFDTSSIVANQTYTPQSSGCTYLSGFISTSASRYGGLYRGTVGNATHVNVHSMGKSIKSTESNDNAAGSSAGDSFFVAIWEIRIGPAYSDVSDFHAYFQHGTTTTGASTTPHTNYRVIPWVYGG